MRAADSDPSDSETDRSRILLSPPDVDDAEGGCAECLRLGWIAPVGPELVEFERSLVE